MNKLSPRSGLCATNNCVGIPQDVFVTLARDRAICQIESPASNIETNTSLNDKANDELLGIVGQSSAILALRKQITMYATMPFPVLIEGESGCGKELIANALHELSSTKNSPYKILNCAAISPTLLECTLFGHSKGAYTGANNSQVGFFEEAANGTLFLDEIGDLPLNLQANLLRVMENGEFQRVGETITRRSHARIIAATNRCLRDAVKTGLFRRDLYHRLNVFSITAPPLRTLGSDKLRLLDHFRHFYAQQLQHLPFELDTDALSLWEQYHFPGNTRELRNIVIRLATKYPDAVVNRTQLLEELDPSVQLCVNDHTHTNLREKILSGHFDLDSTLREQENLYIEIALKLASNSMSNAAKLLGINRSTLYSRMDAHEKSRVAN